MTITIPNNNVKLENLLARLSDGLVSSWSGSANAEVTLYYTFSLTGNNETSASITDKAEIESQAIRDSFVLAAKMWSNYGGVTFNESDSENPPSIIFASADTDSTGGRTWYDPDDNNESLIIDAEVYLAEDRSNNDWGYGTYNHLVVMHEMGHGLGLFNHYGRNDASIMNDIGGVFTAEYSYFSEPTNFASTPMVYDIAAIQFLYGSNTDFNGAGLTTFDLADVGNNTAENAHIVGHVSTIWDGGGGGDKITAENYTNDDGVRIDLRDGAITELGLFGIDAEPWSFAEWVSRDKSANYINKQLEYIFTKVGDTVTFNAFGSQIEDAVGSDGNDLLIGNDSYTGGEYSHLPSLSAFSGNNTLRGLEGHDVILGRGGNDTITGDGGEDLLVGGLGNDYLYGGADRDDLSGDEGDDRLWGDSGSDRLWGGSGNDILYGGADNDYLNGEGGGEDHLYGGTGQDIFGLNDNTFVEDATTEDFATWGPVHLTGGVQQWWMESGYVYWSPFSSIVPPSAIVSGNLLGAFTAILDAPMAGMFRYGLTTSNQLKVQVGHHSGYEAVIEDYDLDIATGEATAGIVAFRQVIGDSSLSQFANYVKLALLAGYGVLAEGLDPLVIDLDGDGVELTRLGAHNSVYYDFDSNGYAENMAWVKPDDGFLVRDLNSNGTIDGMGEMFGDATTSGFVHLAEYDDTVNGGNADGVIDSLDGGWGDLGVWQDFNNNGITDSGELMTLDEAGIAEISLTTSAPADDEVRGNTINSEAVVTFTDARTSTISDVILERNPTDTQHTGDNTISVAAEALPELRGFGEMVSLRVAMTDDSTLFDLVDDVVDLGTTATLADVQTDVPDILFRWAGVDGVAATSMDGGNFDQQKLAFLEKYFGFEMTPRDGGGVPEEDNVNELIESWDDVVGKVTIRLAIQGPLASLMNGITYDATQDHMLLDDADALAGVYVSVLGELSSTPSIAEQQWDDQWGPILQALHANLKRADNVDVKPDYVTQALVQALDATTPSIDLQDLVDGLQLENVHIGTSGADTLTRSGEGLNIYVGSGGADSLNGGVGQDVYVMGASFGNTVILDQDSGEMGDRLRLAFHEASDVSMERSGDDLLITDLANSETIRVVNQYKDPIVGAGGQVLSANYSLEEIQFADGTIFEAIDVAAQIGAGTSGADTIEGTGSADQIEGFEGDDLLKGGDNGDTYYYGEGDGDDIIQDVMTNPYMNGADTLIMLDDFTGSDMIFSRVADSDDLVMTFDGVAGSITFDGQFYYGPLGYQASLSLNDRVEAIFFSEGQAMSWLDIQNATMNTYITDDADVTYGFGTSETFASSLGDDTMVGFDGGDTYHFDIGSGADVIQDSSRYPETFISGLIGYNWSQDDAVVFGEGIAVEDVTFSRLTAAGDLLISIEGEVDTLTIEGQFDGTKLDLFNLLGITWFDRVEKFQFADDTELTWEDVLADITSGDEGANSLWGAMYEDTMDGKAGNDYLSGGDAGDTYIFNAGDGQDIIEDNKSNILVEGDDRVLFGAGIAVADTHFSRVNDTDMLITFDGSSDSITIQGQYEAVETGPFGTHEINRIEQFEWADSTVMTWSQIADAVIADSSTSGNDYILGTHFDNTLVGGLGNDTLLGGNGADTYTFELGDGQDVIWDRNESILANDGDALVFGSGILTSDIILERVGEQDVKLSIDGTTDSVTIQGQFMYTSIDYHPYEIESIEFADSTVWSVQDLRDYTLQQMASSGSDVIEAFWTDDTVTGGLGNDTLRGGDGSDTYTFSAGDGQDVIEEKVDNVFYDDDDAIVFDSSIDKADVNLSRSGDDLTLSFTGTSDTITIAGQFGHGAYFGGWQDIESITFSDSTVWTDADLREMLLEQSQTTGADTITGYWGDDTFEGGLGNDTIYGLGGGDTYLFEKNDGQDTIYESVDTVYEDGADSIVFGADYDSTDVTFNKSGYDLVITANFLNDNSIYDQITVKGHFDSEYKAIEQFVFTDATLYETDVAALAVAGQSTANDDTITGTSSADTIDGGLGNDTIDADDDDDTIWGGAGDDTLEGGYGDDLFHYATGDGNDFITDVYGDDSLQFATGITLGDLSFSLVNNNADLRIDVTGGGAVTIDGQILEDQIEHFNYDGGSLTGAAVRGILLDQISTSGDDLIEGFEGMTYEAGLGNDTINSGYYGDDSFIYNLGDGQDVISDDYGTEVLYMQGINLSDVVFSRVNNAEDLRIQVSDGGSVTVKGHYYSDIRMMDSVVLDDATLSYNDIHNYILNKSSSEGDDTIYGHFFDDAINALGGNDFVESGEGDDTIFGGAGNDTIDGGYDGDVIFGGDGNDVIDMQYAEDADTIYGGAGNDTIGSSGADYIDGEAGDDVIHASTDEGQTLSGGDGFDILDFSDLASYMNATFNMQTAEYVVHDSFWDEYYSLEHVTSFEGVRTGYGTDTVTGSDNADYISVGDYEDVVTAGGGDDTVNGGDGDDTLDGGEGFDIYEAYSHDIYDYSWVIDLSAQTALRDIDEDVDALTSFEGAIGGNGDDTLTGSAGANLLSGMAADDELYGAGGDDTLDGGDGADELYGGLGSDVLDGGAGDDVLRGDSGDDMLTGGAGDDVFVMTSDNGAEDTIADYTIGEDIINMQHVGSVATMGDLAFSDDGSDAIISFGTGQTIRLLGVSSSSLTSSDFFFESTTPVTLSGGSGADNLIGGSSADELYGYAGADTLDGSGGDDYLEGGYGDDVYLYNLGDGDDELEETGGFDTIRFGAGISAEDISASKAGGSLTLMIAGGGSIYNPYHYGDEAWAVDQLVFEDESVMTRAQFEQLINIGTSGDDTLEGTNAADTLQGAGGNDMIYGYDGDDTFVYNLGDGDDELDDTLGFDTIQFGAGIDVDDVTATDADGGIKFLIAGGGSIHNPWQFSSADWTIDQLVFDDSTVLSKAQLEQLIYKGTSAADTIDGSSSADTIDGGGGNDVLSGLNGNDVMYGGAGDDDITGGGGHDTIYGGDDADSIDGGADSDVLYGDSGVDYVQGNAGADTVYGGDGADTVRGGSNADVVYGDAGDDCVKGDLGNDTLWGGDGNDSLYGGNGADSVDGGAGSDLLYGEGNADYLQGNAGTDTIHGGLGDDTLRGGADADALYGDEGADTLKGDLGDDTLSGGDDADVLIGGDGADQLTGGAGADIFTFEDLSYSTDTMRDVITDFVQNTDLIDLSSLSFTGIQSGAASGTVLGYTVVSGNTIIEADGSAFSIELTGSISLAGSDFMFS